MSRLHRLILGAGLAALVVPLGAQAGHGGKGGKHAGGAGAPAARQPAILKYDTNSNGVIDEAEREALKAALSNDRRLKRYDTDGDGKLSDQEIADIKLPGHHKKK
jgi:hypothetical protein